MGDDYSLWMLEYSHCLTQPLGWTFYGKVNLGTRPLAFSYTYAEGNGHKILFDCGHDMEGSNGEIAVRDNITDWRSPAEVLGKIGVSPEEIDTIILTHAHFDHIGAMRHFPNATFYIQRCELEGSQWALDNIHLFRTILGALDPNDVEQLVQLKADGRLVLLEKGASVVLPGITAVTLEDTHTLGSQYILIENSDAKWVVTGDNMYSYENAEGFGGDGTYVPVGLAGGSAWNLIRGIDEMLHAATDSNHLIISHEPAVFDRWPSRKDDDNLSLAELSLAAGTSSRL
ncbi:MAG: MBL fold metallo-hydrolase [Propionibacteriaceae bacterium]|jgi:glyoxylase-like metal-dependent hydrolase (beta-lactamase superfamily II)|nr:MBL fold metallo-hydrolase [Propionibacteriaceae bacterium]